jgi:hypothetical protein
VLPLPVLPLPVLPLPVLPLPVLLLPLPVLLLPLPVVELPEPVVPVLSPLPEVEPLPMLGPPLSLLVDEPVPGLLVSEPVVPELVVSMLALLASLGGLSEPQPIAINPSAVIAVAIIERVISFSLGAHCSALFARATRVQGTCQPPRSADHCLARSALSRRSIHVAPALACASVAQLYVSNRRIRTVRAFTRLSVHQRRG